MRTAMAELLDGGCVLLRFPSREESQRAATPVNMLRVHTVADLPALRARRDAVFPERPEYAEYLGRIILLLELGCGYVRREKCGLVVKGIAIGPRCWRKLSGGRWQRYADLTDLVQALCLGNPQKDSRPSA
jgi:hypothetical protein